MTSPGPATPDRTPAGRPSPYATWAVAHGTGPQSERCAEQVREVCTARGLDGPMLGITEAARRRHLHRYDCLILITPSMPLGSAAGGEAAELLGPSTDLAGAYRARWQHGLVALQSKIVPSYDAGLLQVVGPEELLAAAAATSMLTAADASYDLTASLERPDMLLDILQEGFTAVSVVPAGHRAAEDMEEAWMKIEEWGLARLAQVDLVLDLLAQLREDYEDDRRPGMQRPLGRDVAMNRLDVILDHPERSTGPRKNWMADNAKLLREVVEKIAEEINGFHNPQAKRDSTSRFTQLYDRLRTLQHYLKTVPPSSWPASFHE